MAGFLNYFSVSSNVNDKKYTIMKKNQIITLATFAFLTLFLSYSSKAQDKVFSASKEAKAAFIKTDESMKGLFNNSYGYVIFPKVSKAALVVGGAGAEGAVYEKVKKIGTAKLAQVSVGAQVGGQTYREVIFFENKDALDRFKENKVEFSGQVSAVAAKSGASANAKYTDGVQVFTQEIGGLMAEASIGGQKFTFKGL
jgi:lipid-binding SYLF domain-containing protein